MTMPLFLAWPGSRRALSAIPKLWDKVLPLASHTTLRCEDTVGSKAREHFCLEHPGQFAEARMEDMLEGSKQGT